VGLVSETLSGNRRALARLATHLENDDELATRALPILYPHSGRAITVGITGPPGAGKSTLVNALIGCFRDRGQTVGVIAIDPTSPLSGGAALGDRIRMLDRFGDSGVFIRSMASRGRAGGLAPATASLIHLLDAAGFDIVMIETVGIGQAEIDIANLALVTVLVQVPGLGDAVQNLKAGILEYADIFVVNKADLPGADATARELRGSLTFTPFLGADQWAPPVIKVSATERANVAEVAEAVERRFESLSESGELARRRESIARREIADRIEAVLLARLRAGASACESSLVESVALRRKTPAEAAMAMLDLNAASGPVSANAFDPRPPGSQSKPR
jgi:LAO/AO transport system kinase